MDLSALGSTLPPGLADAEREMGDKFRAAALSITNLYKSSLSYTKQAYQVGYSSCLADVLSTVQSSIASGQDASQSLSRLMDWAEAREAAMAAFAAEETDETQLGLTSSSAPMPTTRRAALTKQALTHMVPQRPASAPVPDHMLHDEDASPAGPSDSKRQNPMPGLTPIISPSTESNASWKPTPAAFASSLSPLISSPASFPRPPVLNPSTTANRKTHHSPIRSTVIPTQPPSSTFNPSLPPLPAAGVPFVSSTSQNVPVGSKRALVDFEMGEEPSNGIPSRSTPSRAAKRRSMGTSLGKGEDGSEGDKDRDKRRGGRRGHGGHGGHGASAGSGVI